jgi:hypothetical protein
MITDNHIFYFYVIMASSPFVIIIFTLIIAAIERIFIKTETLTHMKDIYVTKFLWFPKRIDNETKWLCKVSYIKRAMEHYDKKIHRKYWTFEYIKWNIIKI